MANTDYLKNFLTDVANAIREKKGSAGLINPQDFSNEIRNLVGLPSVDNQENASLATIIANIADDVIVSVKGRDVTITVKKNFAS